MGCGVAGRLAEKELDFLLRRVVYFPASHKVRETKHYLYHLVLPVRATANMFSNVVLLSDTNTDRSTFHKLDNSHTTTIHHTRPIYRQVLRNLVFISARN